jgi:DNA (cytosine-5)-methyltransferase 1
MYDVGEGRDEKLVKSQCHAVVQSYCPPRTFLEFFAGIGLVHLGLAPYGWRCIYANDIDPKKREMYGAMFKEVTPYHVEDIWNTAKVIARIPGEADLATASFPCVDLSLAGNRKGLAGQESGTFFGFAKVIKHLALQHRTPKALLIENVVGFLTSHGGRDFQAAVTTLANLGYFLDAFVLDAKYFTPQSRPRLFIIGCSKGGLYDGIVRQSKHLVLDDPWEAEISSRPELRPSQLVRMMRTVKLSTGWIAFTLPPLPAEKRGLNEVIDIDEQQEWWDEERVEKHLGAMHVHHRERIEKMRYATSLTVGTIYRRVRQGGSRSEIRTDGLAGCLRTPRGGSSKQIVFVAGNGAIRMRWMSPREYARLQGAPDFPIQVDQNQALFGFGDAVCVPAISWIAAHVLEQIFPHRCTQ